MPPTTLPIIRLFALRCSGSDHGWRQAHDHALRLGEPLVALVEQCLAQDPRPAYQVPAPERIYGAKFWDLDVRWHYPAPGLIRVLELTQ